MQPFASICAFRKLRTTGPNERRFVLTWPASKDQVMPPTAPPLQTGSFAIAIAAEANGQYVCEVTPSMEGQSLPTMRFHGQNPNHAIAIALENLARSFRIAAEAEQKIDWDAVNRLPSGEVKPTRFHVILHYEHVGEDESKFEAMANTQLGNTVIENAEISVIQVDPDLPMQPWGEDQ
jgi:phosphoribosylformylglycinamidine (FGAM) synthase PurS component